MKRLTRDENFVTPYKILVLEDEETTGSEIQFHIENNLKEKGSIVKVIDNLEEATKIVQYANCDLMVADLKVRKRHGSKELVDSESLLLNIKKEKYFIPLISHTAYKDKHKSIIDNKLAEYAIQKDLQSNDIVVKRSTSLAKNIIEFRSSIHDALLSLYQSAKSENIFDKQYFLDESRYKFGKAEIPYCIPNDYRKATNWLISFVMRLSSIKSSRFNLNTIRPDLLPILEMLRFSLEKPNFIYKRDAIAVMQQIEIVGYRAIMRIDV